MKKWNTPEITTLDLNETKSGLICTEIEFWPIINDNFAKSEPKQDQPDSPVTPKEDPVDPISDFS